LTCLAPLYSSPVRSEKVASESVSVWLEELDDERSTLDELELMRVSV
jgi:hypothetical protein